MDAIARAQQRIEDAAAGRTDPAAMDAALQDGDVVYVRESLF